ncbi:MAG: hypothetical protein WDZ77_00090 [Candidatus Pacearchaeota archaeon]
MFWKPFISGVFIKAVTAFDDVMIHVPVAANASDTKFGRIAFSIGVILAITLAILFSFVLASFIKGIPNHREILAGAIIFIALSIYFEWFDGKEPKKKVKSHAKKISKFPIHVSLKPLLISFLIVFMTLIDDIVAYSSLFLGTTISTFYAILGIFAMTFVEVGIIIYFSEKVSKFQYKKEITFIGLLIVSAMILSGVL